MILPEYLAGFFDGEGTFYIGKQFRNDKEYPHASILLSQSGEDGKELLLLIQKQYGGNLYQHLTAGQYKSTKNAYKLYWNKDEGIELCVQLIPHLVLKKESAKLVLAYLTRNNISE